MKHVQGRKRNTHSTVGASRQALRLEIADLRSDIARLEQERDAVVRLQDDETILALRRENDALRDQLMRLRHAVVERGGKVSITYASFVDGAIEIMGSAPSVQVTA